MRFVLTVCLPRLNQCCPNPNKRRESLGFTEPNDRLAAPVARVGTNAAKEDMDAETQQATADRVAAPAAAPHSPAPETLRLYASDWAAFVTWCRVAGAAPLPAAPATIAAYLSTLGERLSAGALARRAAAIAAQHRQHGLASPASDPAVTTLLRHARRTATRRRVPSPTATRLTRMATACPGDLAGLRDRALLLLLVVAGLGRAALVSLDVEQVRFIEAGVDLTLHSQPGAERTVTVRWVASLGTCPVRALKDWMEATDSRFGPVFRKVDRWGNVEHRRLGTDAIRRILARRDRGRRGAVA
jgi:integrase